MRQRPDHRDGTINQLTALAERLHSEQRALRAMIEARTQPTDDPLDTTTDLLQLQAYPDRR